MEPLKLNILGGFTLVDRSGAPLGLAAKKARALLAYLALAGGPVPRDRLATLLWEDRDEAQARSSLRQALSALRRALGDAADALRADTETVALDPDLVAVDARDFEAAAAGPSTTAQERAAALYRGDLLDGLDARAPAFDDWLRGERQRLLGLAIAVLGRRLDAALEKGADAAALQAATRLVVLDPAQEPAHRALMRLHARQGRRTDALKQYRRLETVLRRELAVAPEPETQQLYADILNRRDAPAATTSPAPAAAPSPRAPISDSAPAPELRQASVLYADLCGFTAMTAALDPEQVHAVTGRFFQVVDALVMAHGGTVHRHIGDNVMAVFGVPVAHGNDAQRAVATARAVHAAMAGMAADLRAEVGPDLDQNLAAHVGIASGPVIASRDRGEPHVTGSAANLAARLTDLARAGEILVCEVTAQALDGRFVLEDAGEERVKGVPHPVRLHKVRGACAPGAVPARTPLVGRHAERLQLDGALRTALDVGRGLTLVLRGAPGLGKTRLVEGFMDTAETQGFATHLVRILDFGEDSSRNPLRSLVADLLGLDPQAGDEARRHAALTAAPGLATPHADLMLTELLEATPTAAERNQRDTLEPGRRRDLRAGVVADLVRQAAGREPTAIVVEDVHWADRPLLDLLAGLTGTVADCRAVLLLTTRTGEDPMDRAWRNAAGEAPLITLDLPPLRDDDLRDLARELCGDMTPLAERCVARAGGNPLFLEHLLRGAERLGDTDAVPGTIQNIVLARLDALDGPDRAALQAASILGQRFTLAALHHLLEDDRYACDALVRGVFLRPDGDGYRFTHALVRDAVQASLLTSRRRALHGRAADWFAGRDPVLFARHLDRAGDRGAPFAYLNAARLEAEGYRFKTAVDLAERGLALDGDPATRHDLALLHGELLRERGAVGESLAAFERALAEAGDDGERQCRALIGCAAALRLKDDLKGALDRLDRAAALARGPRHQGLLAEILSLRGNILFPMGELDACLEAHQRALELAGATGSPLAEARALGGMGDALYLRGRMITADGYYARCVDLARRHGWARIEAGNLAMRGLTGMYRLRLDQALAASEQAGRIAVAASDYRGELLSVNNLSTLHLAQDRPEAAKGLLERSLVLCRDMGSPRFELDCLSQMALALHGLGRAGQAWATAREALDQLDRTDDQFVGPTVLAFAARVAPDRETRRALLDRGLRLLDSNTISHNHLAFHEQAIEIAWRDGDGDAMDRCAKALDLHTRAEPLPWATLIADRGRALAAWGRGDRNDTLRRRLADLAARARQAGLVLDFPPTEDDEP